MFLAFISALRSGVAVAAIQPAAVFRCFAGVAREKEERKSAEKRMKDAGHVDDDNGDDDDLCIKRKSIALNKTLN